MNGLASVVYNSKGKIEVGNTYPIIVYQQGLDEEAKYGIRYGTLSKLYSDRALAESAAVNLSKLYNTVGHASPTFEKTLGFYFD